MTRDDIIRMAREAGVPLACERFAALIAAEKDKQIAFLKESHDAIRELAYKTGVEAEREACARVCEETTASWSQYVYKRGCADCAAAIRARSEP